MSFKMSKQLQTLLDSTDNVPVTSTFRDTHSAIRACWEIISNYLSISKGAVPDDLMNTLIKPIQTAIETQAALIKSIQEYQTKMAQDENSSNHHAASNDMQLYNSIKQINENIDGLKHDISDMKTHFWHQSSIIDDLTNQVQANSQEATNLRSLIKDHMATKHHNSPEPEVVYIWDVQPYELNIRTKTSVPSNGHTYVFKYMLNGVEKSITKSDANLKVGTELGTLTYTPLNKDVSKVIIERTL